MKRGQKKESAKVRAARLRKASQIAGSFVDEIKRIEWPGKKSLKRYVQLALASVFVCSFVVYLIDITIRNALVFAGNLVKVIFG